MTTAVDEAGTIFDTLSVFFKAQSDYLLGSTSVPPVLDSSLFNHENLLTYTLGNLPNGASFALGSAQDAIFTSAAIGREMNMALATKNDLYTNFIAEANNEVSFYDQSSGFVVGVLTGGRTNGAQC